MESSCCRVSLWSFLCVSISFFTPTFPPPLSQLKFYCVDDVTCPLIWKNMTYFKSENATPWGAEDDAVWVECDSRRPQKRQASFSLLHRSRCSLAEAFSVKLKVPRRGKKKKRKSRHGCFYCSCIITWDSLAHLRQNKASFRLLSKAWRWLGVVIMSNITIIFGSGMDFRQGRGWGGGDKTYHSM